MGGMFEFLDTASNSLKTEREAMAYAAQNVANMYTPGYKARTPVLASRGRNQSFSEMVENLAEGRELGLNSMILNKTPGAGTMVASVEVDYSEGSRKKIQKNLKWYPNMKFSFGLEKTIDWYLNNTKFFNYFSKKIFFKRLGLKL